MKATFLLLALVVGCGENVSEEGVSESKFVKSDDGKQLFVTLDSEKTGYCVTEVSGDKASDNKLLTAGNGLTKRQLGQAFRFMSYKEYLTMIGLTAGGYILAMGVGVSIPFLGLLGNGSTMAVPLKVLIPVALAVPVLFMGSSVVVPVYTYYKAKQEGESARERNLEILAGGIAYEVIRRDKRVHEAVSKEMVLMLSDKKMENVISRITDTKGESSGMCDLLVAGK